MNSYLVRASSLRAHFKISQVVCKLFLDRPAGYSLSAAILEHSHFFSIAPVPTNCLRYTAFLCSWPPNNNGMIDLFDLSRLKKLNQSMVGFVAFRNDHYPGSIFIKTVDDAWPFHAAYSRQVVAMGKKAMNKCPLPVP
jgi:hypothetical protein